MMTPQNRLVVPAPRRIWIRIINWGVILMLAPLIFLSVTSLIRGLSRPLEFWEISSRLFGACVLLVPLKEQWLRVNSRVLTVLPEGLLLEKGAFPYRTRWLVKWKDVILVRSDDSLMLMGAKSWRPSITIESHLNDASRDMLIDRLNAIYHAQGIAQPNADTYTGIRLEDARFCKLTSGGANLSKYWRG